MSIVKSIIDETLLTEPELELYLFLQQVPFVELDKHYDILKQLAPILNRYMDNVYINHENKDIRRNRKNMLFLAKMLYDRLCDWSKL